ncbi:MAG: xylulokinase [Gammaproteobacteria bacterium]|nr:xylulokinase [Gammaproteobacteria bacterium]
MKSTMPYILGVDLGAGSLKASLVRSDGVVVGHASHPIDTLTPKFGWSEQDPEQWYTAFCNAVPRALRAADVSAEAVDVVGISGGAHIQVLLDSQDQIIRPALLWSDQRSAEEAQELHELAGDTIITSSMNKANATWTLPQLLWIKRHEPENIARVAKLFLAKDYLRFRITGDWHTDFSDAVGALMADAESGGWSQAICQLIDWPTATLPPIVDPWEVVGAVAAGAAEDAGLRQGTPVVTGSNDTTVELFGAGAISPGQGAIKLATAGVLFLTVDQPIVNPPVSCYPHIIPGMYYTATGTNSCASAHRWLADEIFASATANDADETATTFEVMDQMAAQVSPGSKGLIFHPYLQGERAPYWDPYLRADFIGITMQHSRRHFARALYEGIAFSIRDLMESSRVEGLEFKEIRLLGGGARSGTWRQIISDVLGVEVIRPESGDASFGAALVAGVGAGIFSSLQEAVQRCVRILDHCQPDPDTHDLYSDLFAVYKDAQQALAPLDHRLYKLIGES